MIDRHVLAALAAGIQAGDEHAARRALQRADWVIRGLARRRLERALLEAACAIAPVGIVADFTGPEDSRHQQRVAALSVANIAVPDPADRARVYAAYHALPVTNAPRLPITKVLVSLIAGALVTLVALAVREEATPDGPMRSHAGPLPPPSRDAYEKGGVPLPDPALEELLRYGLSMVEHEVGRAPRFGRDVEERSHPGSAIAASPAITRHGLSLTFAWAWARDPRPEDRPRASRGARRADGRARW